MDSPNGVLASRRGRFATRVVAACFLLIGMIPRMDAAADSYVQRISPRLAPLSRQPLCGRNVGRTQKMVIMADEPRQAALAAMRDPRVGVPLADRAYSNAAAAERDGSSSCVDLYFEAVAFSWNFIRVKGSPDAPEYPEAWQIYHNGLKRLMETGQRFGRLDLQQGLRVNTAVGTQTIPVTRQGFCWQPQDFNRLVVVTDEMVGKLTNHYYKPGLGVPLVVIRSRSESERFYLNSTPFAATVVLRPSLAVLSGHAPPIGVDSSHGHVELYDPLRVSTVSVDGRKVKMASDTSAPFEYAMQGEAEFNPLLGMLRPGDAIAEEKLFMIEPYQRGKFPLVFVHGLMSSPRVWGNIANEILARPEYRDRFQLWAFQYPTGIPFVRPAATLREELTATRKIFDPQTDDPAMSKMAIIGHSMGGLVAKLQVTSSDDRLWCSIARRPLNSINATEKQREEMRRLFCFDPLPFVSRVVFIGTPHHGSGLARTSIGRLGSCLVEQTTATRLEHQMLIKNNPGVFSKEVTNRMPTSVDMLNPSSALLAAIQQLCPSAHVQLHSIIGTGCPSLLYGPADGVVPVRSARHSFVSSERRVHTSHTKLHSDPRALDEVLCILRRHIWEANDSPFVESVVPFSSNLELRPVPAPTPTLAPHPELTPNPSLDLKPDTTPEFESDVEQEPIIEPDGGLESEQDSDLEQDSGLKLNLNPASG